MKFTTAITSAIFVATSLAAPTDPPFAIVKRDDGSTSNVGGSVGCFGTDGNLVSANITPSFQAIFYSENNCKGRVLASAANQVSFGSPINTKSISLNLI